MNESSLPTPPSHGMVGPSRRQVLGMLAAGAAGGVGFGLLGGCSRGDGTSTGPSASTTTTPDDARSIAAAASRVLVVIELNGGNDGLSTLVPHVDGRYHDLRPTLALAEEELLDLGDGLALNASLAELHAQGLAILSGVGASAPSLSHFDMIARWWAGTPDETTRSRTGFLGRLCDRVGAGDGLTGVSISPLTSPALRSSTPTTVTLPSGTPLGGTIGGSPLAGAAFHRALEAFGELQPEHQPADASSEAIRRVLAIDASLRMLPTMPDPYLTVDPMLEGFARQLGFASQLIRSEADVRVIHVPMGSSDFDTHAGHRHRHARLMKVLGPGLALFRRDLEEAGLSDRVLIATTSEFGRRVAENDGGLDHGAASCALLMGPVVPGVHGEAPALGDLDADGNLVASVSFARYFATMASWLGVDARSVLDVEADVIPGLLAV